MNVIDLSHAISPGMPVYPGTEPPQFSQACTIAANGFAEKRISLHTHTGTHVDVPGHILEGGLLLDEMGPRGFVGSACVIDASGVQSGEIGASLLQAEERAISESDFVLIHTGWSRSWGQESYLSGFPILTMDAARWLHRRRLKGVGFDTISADPAGSVGLEIHREILRAGTIIIENLTGLDALVGRSLLFSCLPLRLAGGDGSPVRAVAILR